jgi:hypothetical protein
MFNKYIYENNLSSFIFLLIIRNILVKFKYTIGVIGVNSNLGLLQRGHLVLAVAIFSISIQDAHQKHTLHIEKKIL